MALRIALISLNRHKDPYPVYPLGTAYLKQYLQTHLPESQVDILDMNICTDEFLANYLLEMKPSYIGVSIRNVDGANSLDRRAFFGDYKKTIDWIKLHSKAPLIIGGAGFSIFPKLFVKELGADYGINGEGEWALLELIKNLEAKNTDHGLITNLHTPQCSGIGTCKYIKTPRPIYEPSLVEYYWKQSGMLNIQTKRGCPYSCIYCTYPTIDGRQVRTVDVEAIVETITKAKRDFGVNYWFFTDSVFNLNKTYNQELCEALIKADLGISWGAYFAPARLGDDEMALYAKSGLTHIEFGTESFCDETLEAYGKRFTFADVLESSELALKHNVYYSHFMILAGMGEDKKRLLETIENSKKLRHTVIFPYVGMRIYPGTKLQAQAIKEGVITPETDLLMPAYYVAPDFDLADTKQKALATGKSWVFPDDPQNEMMSMLKLKRNKKGPLWEYLRKP